jgi:DNA-binding XRE family transcriptional regulator
VWAARFRKHSFKPRLTLAKAKIVRQPNQRTRAHRLGVTVRRVWCAASPGLLFPTNPSSPSTTERFLFAVAPEFSMHPYPSIEVPRCPHCGLIQFRHTIANCVRCKKPSMTSPPLCSRIHSVPIFPNSLKEALAQRVRVAVKTLRKERNFTQQLLAALMGTGRSYISKLESGRVVPSLQTLECATSAFGIDLAELFLRLHRQQHAEPRPAFPSPPPTINPEKLQL